VSTVDLLALLAATDAELLAAHGRWYIAGRDPRYLRRNALVALGNIGDAGDPATVATIDTWVRSDDGLLAEHARWAADRLGHADRTGQGSGSPR
jgi:epoxyqueuosine reductase